MKRLPDSIKEAFNQGNVTVKITSRVFSAIETDQANEENNKAIKVDNGALGIKDNGSGLLEWTLPGSYVAKMVYESTNVSPANHRGDRKWFEKKFRLGQIKLIEAFKHFEKPFPDLPEKSMNIFLKEVISAKGSSSVRSAL